MHITGKSMLRRSSPYLLLLILVVLFLWKPIFTGAALLPGDYLAQMSPWNTVIKPSAPAPQWNPLQWDAIAQFYPWRVFYAHSMHNGRIPLSNPHQFCGTPFLANGQSAVMYPLNLVFLLFDPITAFTVFAFIHLLLSAVFMYLLLRELGCKALGGIVGAIVFTFSAFMVLWMELPTFISVAAYLPMLLLLIHRAVERRSVCYGALAGLTMALTVLAGHLQIAFYVALAAGLWWIWKLISVRCGEGTDAKLKVVLPCLAFIAIAVIIAAPQLLPSMEFAKSSHRASQATESGYENFVGNAVPLYQLVTVFLPNFYGNPSTGSYFLMGRFGSSKHMSGAEDYMEYGMYAGILPLMLALVAITRIRKERHVAYFALLSLFALLLAIGTPLNALFYYLIPGFSSLGGPQRILLLYLFGVASLAGFGADYFADCAANRIQFYRKERIWGEQAALSILLVIIVLFAVTNTIGSDFVESLTGHWYSSFATAGGLLFLVFLLLSTAVLILQSRGLISRSLFGTLVIALVVADLFAFGINYNPTCGRDKVYPETSLVKKLKKLPRTARIAPINPSWSLFKTPNAILPPNAAMVYGLYDAQGYDSLYTREYKDLSSRVQDLDSSPPENGNMVLLRQYNDKIGQLADYVISRNKLETVFDKVRLVDHIDDLYIYKIKGTKLKTFSYNPFSFRLGLFMMLVGVMALGCIFTYHYLERNNTKQ